MENTNNLEKQNDMPSDQTEANTTPTETKEEKERRRQKAIADMGFWQYVDTEAQR